MAVFGLKNMGRDEWSDKQELDHTSSDGSMTPKTIEFIAKPIPSNDDSES